MKIPVHYDPPTGYARIYAATEKELAERYADLLLASGRTVCLVRVQGFRFAVYART